MSPNSPYAFKSDFRRYQREAVIGFVILLLGVAAAFYAQNQDRANRREELRATASRQLDAVRAAAVKNCNDTFISVRNTRAVLLVAAKTTTAQYEAGVIDKKQYVQAKQFYDVNLSNLRLPDCREIAALIADDPDEPVEKVTPKHP